MRITRCAGLCGLDFVFSTLCSSTLCTTSLTSMPIAGESDFPFCLAYEVKGLGMWHDDEKSKPATTYLA